MKNNEFTFVLVITIVLIALIIIFGYIKYLIVTSDLDPWIKYWLLSK